MKKQIIFLFSLFMIVFSISCDEEFLERYPKDQITEKNFWTSANQLKVYANQFYTSLPHQTGYSLDHWDDDVTSDNMVNYDYDVTLAGERTVPSSGGGWYWNNIREVNYFLENYQKCEDNFEEYKHYVGEVYFFRAFYYFQKIKQFGDVPWINKTLNIDSDELYKERTSRRVVVDSILSDLDKAYDYLEPKSDVEQFRIYDDIAMFFKSRVALYEGTWEKYHQGTDFGVENPEVTYFLEEARDAAKAVMETGDYGIWSTGKPNQDYYHLFNRYDYSSNPEVLLWNRYDYDAGLYHQTQWYMMPWRGGGVGLTKSLVDAYLDMDGEPIAISDDYVGDNTLQQVVQNRDPRLRQTFRLPGEVVRIFQGDTTYFDYPPLDKTERESCPSGYQLQKGSAPDYEVVSGEYRISTVPTIIFRYAEVLLNYAEARAELGELTQDDVDKTINILRDRVGVDHLQLSNIPSDPNWNFPDLSPRINEVRRARRVELACEGFREDDVLRWRAHHLFKDERKLGAKAAQFEGQVEHSVPVNSEGYLDPHKNNLPNGYQFDENRDYLAPLPQNQVSLSDGLEQNPGWNE